MSRKRHNPEQIIGKLRGAEVALLDAVELVPLSSAIPAPFPARSPRPFTRGDPALSW